jgi:hypothetical protein
MNTNAKIELIMSAHADPIWKQLKKHGVKVAQADCYHFQRALHGLIQLRFLGCMGDAEYKRTCDRLAAKILKFASQQSENQQQS